MEIIVNKLKTYDLILTREQSCKQCKIKTLECIADNLKLSVNPNIDTVDVYYNEDDEDDEYAYPPTLQYQRLLV